MHIVLMIYCLAALCISAYTDIKMGKVYNQVFIPALALALVVPFLYGFWEFLLRLALVVLLFFVYKGFIGGGDAKLIMMLIMLAGLPKAAVAVVIGNLLMIAYSYITNPKETRLGIMNGLSALSSFNPDLVKGQGSTLVFAPFLTIGFIGATLIYGI